MVAQRLSVVLAALACSGAAALAGQGAAANAGRQMKLEAAWGAELDTKKNVSPIRRVVNLLHKMREELQAEADKESEMYEKMVCWCETNNKEKTKAVADAEAQDAALSSEIEERAARFGELASTIEQLKEEIAANKATLAQATAIREKEAEEFRGRESDLVQAVTNLRNAIAVLSKHQGTGASAMLQLDAPTMSGIRVLLRDAALKYELMLAAREERKPRSAGKFSLAQTDAGQRSTGVALLDMLGGNGAQQAAEVLPLDIAEHFIARAAASAGKVASGGFLQAAQPVFESRSSARSSEIFGLLKQMQQEFEAELTTAQQEELQAQTAFKELSAAKTEQIESGSKKLDDLQAEDSENSKALSDAKEDLTLTREQRSEDVKFLQNLKLQCNDLDHQWQTRSETRANEMKAVAEAIAILTEDDAADMLRKTATSLLQVRSRSDAAASEAMRRSGAAAALRRAADSPDFEADDLLAAWHGRSTPSVGAAAGPRAQLATLAMSVQLDAFTKIKEIMDKMIADLKQQQAEEVQMKSRCSTSLDENDKAIYDKTELRKDLEARISELEAQMARLADEIKSHNEQIAATQLEVKRAGQQREAENAQFQTLVSDQRATQEILQKAVAKLKDFYEKKIGNKSAFVQTNQEPPVKFNAYKTNAGGGSVIGLIDQIIEDSVRLEKSATDAERQAQSDYENFVLSSNGLIKSLQDEVVQKTDVSAAAKNDHALASADHVSTLEELESLEQYKADLHNECNFLLKNFDIRQKARLQEIEAIQNAKAILSGAESD